MPIKPMVMLGLTIFNMDFVIIMTGIGIISLAGVVVNNAIVLIDYTDQVRARRKEELGLSDEEHLPTQEFLECLVNAGFVLPRTCAACVPFMVSINCIQ